MTCPAALLLLAASVLLLATFTNARLLRHETFAEVEVVGDHSRGQATASGWTSLDHTQNTDLLKSSDDEPLNLWNTQSQSLPQPEEQQPQPRQRSQGRGKGKTSKKGGGNTKPSSSGDDAASQASGGDNVADAGLKAVLDQHNSYRARHGVPALSWSSSVASSAQSWANGCVFEHSRGKNGENLAQGHRSFKAAVDDWYSEASQYQYGADYSPGIGHFTQMVWKATTDLGCGVADCGGQPLYVCQYSPAGNVIGEFAENVLPPGGASRET